MTLNQNISEKASLYFLKKYPHIWSKNSRARRPHIYFIFFQETLSIIANEISTIDNSDKLINIIEEYNKLLSTTDPDDIVKYNKKMYKIYDTAKRWDFYLGLFKHSSNDGYGYYWARNIIANYT